MEAITTGSSDPTVDAPAASDEPPPPNLDNGESAPPEPDSNDEFITTKPTSSDVLCGRGVTTNRHPGNEKFRALVGANKELYVSSTKRDKMAISRSIVEAVRARKPPGRFLEKDTESTGMWYDIGDKKAIEKTSQALRDGAASLRRQLSVDMSDQSVFLHSVFDSVDTSEVCASTKNGEGKPNDGPGHRRAISSPAVTDTSGCGMKRKMPPKLLASDEKSQKEALKRMTESPEGANVTPFRPDRRPTAHRHKRTASAPIGRIFGMETPPGYPYPRQTPPTSPNPYMRAHPQSPYGYSMSPLAYHYPPSPSSPAYINRNSRSYSWGSERRGPPMSQHRRLAKPPARQSSCPSPRGHCSYLPPSPGAPPPHKSPLVYPSSPTRTNHQSPSRSNWSYPYGHRGHHHQTPPHLPPSPCASHPNHRSHRLVYSPYQQVSPSNQPSYYEHQHNHAQSHQRHLHQQNQQYPKSPSHPQSPPVSPGGRYDDSADATLSIPTLGRESHGGDAQSDASVRKRNDGPPPPKWLPPPHVPPRSPRSPSRARKDSSNDVYSNSFVPPPFPLKKEKEICQGQSSTGAPQQVHSTPRSMLLPSRLRETNSQTSIFRGANDPASKFSRSDWFSSSRQMSASLEVSPEASFDYVADQPSSTAAEPSSPPPPPEQICKSFTFVNGQLMESNSPIVMTEPCGSVSPEQNEPITIQSRSGASNGGPNTPKAVSAVETFEEENEKNAGLKIIDFRPPCKSTGKTDSNLDLYQVDDPAITPEELMPLSSPSTECDDMLVMDDRSLSPLPFEDSEMSQEDPLVDLGDLFAPPCHSPTR